MGLTTFSVDGWTGYLGYPWTTDDLGCDWHITAETGWRGSPGPRLDRLARPRRDGDLDPGRTWLAGRVIQLGGRLVAPDHAALVAGMERFAAVLAGGELQPLIVSEDGVHRLVYVRRSTEGAEISATGVTVASWSLALYAPDPLKYESDAVGEGVRSASTTLPSADVGLAIPATVPWDIAPGGTTGHLMLTNDGTAPTRPTVYIAGPAVTPRIEHSTTGRVLEFDTELLAGESLTVVPSTGRVLRNGTADARNTLTATSSPVSLLVMPKGLNEFDFRALSSTGGALMTVEYRPAHY